MANPAGAQRQPLILSDEEREPFLLLHRSGGWSFCRDGQIRSAPHISSTATRRRA